MPDSLLDQPKRSAMLTAQMGMATRAQYSRHVPNSSTTVHIRAIGLHRHNTMRISADNQWYTRQLTLPLTLISKYFITAVLFLKVHPRCECVRARTLCVPTQDTLHIHFDKSASIK